MTIRTLLLLRHAKSSWDDPVSSDFDRPLAPRGRKAAPPMGAAIAARHWLPDRVLVSPSLRTRETWNLVAPHLPAGVEVAYPDELYMADPAEILKLVRAAPETTDNLLVLGHNPGLDELAALLADGGSDAEALGRMAEKFPTAALARFEFQGKWRDLAPGGGHLTHFVRPKDLTPS